MKKMLLSLSVLALASTALFAQQSGARVRVVHASPDAPAVDILVDGAKVLEALPFPEYSEYLALPAGAHEFRVNVHNTSTTVLQATATLAAGKDYTVAAVGLVAGGANPLSVMLLEDDNREPTGGMVKVRIVHAAPSAPAVDIFVTTPFESLEGKNPVLTSVPFKAASGYLSVPIQAYQARITPAGTKTVALNSGRIYTWGGMVRTILAIDSPGGGAPFSLLYLPDRN